MKKVLFATSALVMTAGVAAAEVSLSGDARMGLIYDGNDAQFGSRARVRFTLTGETDTGLSFGASFRADQAFGSDSYSVRNQVDEDGNLVDVISRRFRGRGANDGVKGAVWISGTYGKLSMGDVVSASEAAIGDLYSVGYTEGTFGGDLEEISYLTADGNNLDQGPNILYEYSISGFNLFASASDASDNAWPGAYGTDNPYYNEDTGEWNAIDDDSDSDIAWSLGGSYKGEYTGGTYMIGLGYGKHDHEKEIVVGGEMTYGGFSGKAIYADYKNRESIDFRVNDNDPIRLDSGNYEYDKAYGLSLAYEYDAFIFKGYYRRDEGNAVVDGFSDQNNDTFGLGVDYDLGGGAVLAAGVVDSDWLNDTVADAGIRFKF